MFLIELPRYACGIGTSDWTACSILSTSYWMGTATIHLLGKSRRAIRSLCLPFLVVHPAFSRAVFFADPTSLRLQKFVTPN
jgi:hypothetical protein